MDEAQIKQAIDAHGKAVIDPLDQEHIQRDLVEELHPSIPTIAGLLPIPVKTASIDSLEVHDQHADAVLTYTGDSGSVTIASRWEDRGAGPPQMVSAQPQQ